MLKLTKKDQPTPTWRTIAKFGNANVRSNATPPVAPVLAYLRDVTTDDLGAGQRLLEALLHPDDVHLLEEWPLTAVQHDALTYEAFKAIRAEVQEAAAAAADG